LDDLGAVTSGLFELADAQRTLAWTLNDRQKDLGRTLAREALSQLGAVGLLDSIMDVARVPGLATMFLIKPNVTFPGQIRSELEKLLGEQIWFVIDTKNTFSILSQAIGRNCEKNKISIEEKIRVAHVPLDDLDAVTKARVRLAQQLTGFHVMR
jgi:F420-0:gamma-glutamyl ligase-like protein